VDPGGYLPEGYEIPNSKYITQVDISLAQNRVFISMFQHSDIFQIQKLFTRKTIILVPIGDTAVCLFCFKRKKQIPAYP
jgi:hypothetical protein